MIKDGITETNGEILSVLMIGQSNMAGRGELGDVPPIVNRDCFMLRMGRWQPMHEPVNPDRGIFEGKYHSGISPAASFADTLARESGHRIGLIPCADGGTAIARWAPDEVLFEHAVMMTRLAMRSSRLIGIIWHQGESDCHDYRPREYRENFLRTMTALRRALDAEALPLVIGEISENITGQWDVGDNPPKMNRLLHELAGELPCCGIVGAKELPLKPDGIHFSAASCRELGVRYCREFLHLRGMRK